MKRNIFQFVLAVLFAVFSGGCLPGIDWEALRNSWVDVDGDGWTVEDGDCNDSDKMVHPEATELCNGIDDDCDKVVDNGLLSSVFYADADADSFGNETETRVACSQPEGYVVDNTDCNDVSSSVHPGATEFCNDVDDDCDGTTDEDDAEDALTWYQDLDADTFGNEAETLVARVQPAGFVVDNSDCDDSLVSVHPGATEFCNEIDDDCDSLTDEDDASGARTWYHDADSDSFGNVVVFTVACNQPSGYVANSSDCNDTSASVNSDATEFCNEIDDDCDSVVDEDDAEDALTWYQDLDVDSFGNKAVSSVTCYQPSGYVADNSDCDDSLVSVHPGATEFCNDVDDDCDGTMDEDDAEDAVVWYQDFDGDGYGNVASTTTACYQPSGYVFDTSDCDDGRSGTNPGASEICDSFDNDCDGTTDEDSAIDTSVWYRDADTDSFGNVSVTAVTCYQPSGYVPDATDCDDTNIEVNPDAVETCNGVDDDCNGIFDDGLDLLVWYSDVDGDGYGISTSSTTACAQPTGYVADHTDCDDLDADINPIAIEYCNDIDDDCNGSVDDRAVDMTLWWRDADEDGFGDNGHPVTVPVIACDEPSGYVADHTDCDDLDADINPIATEYCNDIDDDCDGSVDEDDAADALTWYVDADEDGYGGVITTVACDEPSGYVADHADCDDGDPLTNPGAEEIYYDDVDNDCDGGDELWYVEGRTFCVSQEIFDGCWYGEDAYFVGSNPLGSWAMLVSEGYVSAIDGFYCYDFSRWTTAREYRFVVVSAESDMCTGAVLASDSSTWKYTDAIEEYCTSEWAALDPYGFCSSYGATSVVCVYDDRTQLTSCS